MTTKCVICRKPVNLRDKTLVRRDLPAGLNMTRLHRIEPNYWHADCWAEAERSVAESRAAAEEQRRADLRAVCEAVGVDPARYGLEDA